MLLNLETKLFLFFSVKPSLKKVSKYDNKFKKLGEQGTEKKEKADFRSQLKVVKKENVLDELVSKVRNIFIIDIKTLRSSVLES